MFDNPPGRRSVSTTTFIRGLKGALTPCHQAPPLATHIPPTHPTHRAAGPPGMPSRASRRFRTRRVRWGGAARN
jgi:hypothetical protein